MISKTQHGGQPARFQAISKIARSVAIVGAALTVTVALLGGSIGVSGWGRMAFAFAVGTVAAIMFAVGASEAADLEAEQVTDDPTPRLNTPRPVSGPTTGADSRWAA